ncbi:MAG: exonuclease SbcCD subunit D, partial [Actinomycetota bacterium]
GITLVPRIVSPDRGGVIRVPSRDGSEEVRVAALPFLHEAQAVDFMDPSEEWFKSYADRIRLLCAALCKEFDPAGIGILAGHFFVHGAELGGGERQIHIGNQYAATAQALPPGAQYAALGHIHKPQAVKGSAIPARYSGSLLQLDFSERTHGKEVVVVEAVPGRAAKVRPIPLSSGRRLLRVEDTLDGLQARVDELSGAYLDVRVTTDGPTFGLADRVREFLPDAVMVQAVWERTDEQAAVAVGDRALADLYAEFHASARGHGTPAPPELLEAVRELEETVIRATS